MKMLMRIWRFVAMVMLMVVPGMQSCVADTEDFLDSGYLENGSRTNTEMKAALEQLNAAGKSLLGATAPTTASISGDAITATGPAMVIDTQGGASTDDLRTISTENVRSGYAVMLWAASSARVITLRHLPATLGGLSLASETDYVLTPARPILLMLVGTAWKEVMSASSASAGVSDHGKQIFTSNGSFTVPDWVTTLYITAVGGGGGGGGGCGPNDNGVNGTAGGTTQILTAGGSVVATAAGGGFGSGAYKQNALGVIWCGGGPGGAQGGTHGQDGFVQTVDATTYYRRGKGGNGSAGIFGRGGGGNGGNANQISSYGAGGGGGGAGSCSLVTASVNQGDVLAVTIGAGGNAGGAGGSAHMGTSGTAGILIVEW